MTSLLQRSEQRLHGRFVCGMFRCVEILCCGSLAGEHSIGSGGGAGLNSVFPTSIILYIQRVAFPRTYVDVAIDIENVGPSRA